MSQTPASDPLWYYSQAGRECGPVPMARLIELTGAGTVKPTDLVWREGMDDWTAASKVPGLFSAPPAAKSGAPPTARTSPPTEQALGRAGGVVQGALAGLVRPGTHWAKGLLIFGIVLVVVARGCDTLNHRNVARMAAKQAAARQQFDDSWETKRLEVQQRIDKLAGKSPPLPEDQSVLAELRKQLVEMQKDQGLARKELTDGTWRDLEIAARNAKWDNATSAYWHELMFVLGTIAFTVGLILVGFGSQGPERWIALAMLAIIAYSLFVSGAAWTGAPVP